MKRIVLLAFVLIALSFSFVAVVPMGDTSAASCARGVNRFEQYKQSTVYRDKRNVAVRCVRRVWIQGRIKYIYGSWQDYR